MSFFNGSINNLTLTGGNLLTDGINSGNINVAGTTNLAGDIDIAGNLNAVGTSLFDQITSNSILVNTTLNVDGVSNLKADSHICSTVGNKLGFYGVAGTPQIAIQHGNTNVSYLAGNATALSNMVVDVYNALLALGLVRNAPPV